MPRKPGNLNPEGSGRGSMPALGRSSQNQVALNKRAGAGNVAQSNMSKAKAQALRGYILRKGGVTLNSKTLNPVFPKRGYSVGVAPKTAVRIGTSRATPGRVTGAISKIQGKYNPKNIGGWHEKGQVHMDPVKIVKSYSKAQRLGRKFNQQTIFSFTSGNVLPVIKRGK